MRVDLSCGVVVRKMSVASGLNQYDMKTILEEGLNCGVAAETKNGFMFGTSDGSDEGGCVLKEE